MAKAVALISSALCILALATIAQSNQVFDIEGDVYCDPCRVQFPTKFSQNLAGAAVKLQCTNIETNEVAYSAEAVTDANGHYKISVVGEHEKEKCEVSVVKSPREDCKEPMPDFVKSQIGCTSNSGIISPTRFANPIGFMTENVLPACSEVISELLPMEDLDVLN